MTERIAVIGAGISGLTAAYLLAKRHDVVLFESEARLGGHAHTHQLTADDGRTVPVDSGFIVHNERNYPMLRRLLAELGVRTQPTEMSLSVRCDECGLEFAGANRLRGLFPAEANLRNGRYLRMLAQVPRFHREANRLLEHPKETDPETLGEFLAAGGYSAYFIDHFALPLVSAVWSASEPTSGQYPVRYLFEFLRNHGMLSVGGSPSWRTIIGGSTEYVRRIADHPRTVHRATPVRAVHRDADGVRVRDENDTVHEADRVVIATHADQALALLAEPTATQRAVLGAFRYSVNRTLLHTDSTVLPRTRGARASWNYRKATCASGGTGVRVSYHMNRLMRLAEPEDYLVTLNDTAVARTGSVLSTLSYRHPIYDPESVAAQTKLPMIGEQRVRFAGAYHGWGFHEDGCASGIRAAAAFGVRW